MTYRDETATTLIVVLVALGFISFFSLMIVEYAIWQSQLVTVNKNLVYMNQAHRLAESRTRTYLTETLPDSPVLPNKKTLEWKLPPDNIRVETTIRSLNTKLSLNRFREADAGELYKNMVESILEELNYPNRSMKELARWIVSKKEQGALGQGPYGGYSYSAPHRKILHVDEISLISGFKEIGVKEEFRKLFTVYGKGTINPLHFTPDQWELFKSFLGNKLPQLPSTALQSRSTLRDYLSREDVWSSLQESLPFLTKKDDVFRVDYEIERNNSVIGRRTIMTFNYEEEQINLVTRFPTTVSPDDQEDGT